MIEYSCKQDEAGIARDAQLCHPPEDLTLHAESWTDKIEQEIPSTVYSTGSNENEIFQYDASRMGLWHSKRTW